LIFGLHLLGRKPNRNENDKIVFLSSNFSLSSAADTNGRVL
jgi:hypothetical protein